MGRRLDLRKAADYLIAYGGVKVTLVLQRDGGRAERAQVEAQAGSQPHVRIVWEHLDSTKVRVVVEAWGLAPASLREVIASLREAASTYEAFLALSRLVYLDKIRWLHPNSAHGVGWRGSVYHDALEVDFWALEC